MTTLSPRHPRYRSLRVRQRLAEASRIGLIVPEGLIAHGRGEAFDYLLGERSTPSARRAERTAAEWLAAASHPVVSVNGNVAALAAPEIAALANALPTLLVEVNLFHRTPKRAALVARSLTDAGVREVLGVRPTVRLSGLSSDRAWVDRRGIAQADVCLVPLEDGDRAAALVARGVRVISIDLNPLSRTSQTADLPIVDELVRALREIARHLRRPRAVRVGSSAGFDRGRALAEALRSIDRRLAKAATAASASARARRRPGRATVRPSRRAARTTRSRRRGPRPADR
jgi:4-phosphopantoate--beta-alanine ligase